MGAGLGFKTFVTGDVLTAADTNGYLMQGVWVFADAAARTSAVTSPQEGNASFLKDTNSLEIYDGAAWVAYGSGDITGVTAGTGISGGGTTGTVTVTNSMATAIDAKGDLIAGTGADTFDRLVVGANDTVLTADSSTATGLKWATPAAGGMTLISTTTLSGATTTLSSIPGTYKNLQLMVRSIDNGTNYEINVTINNNTTNNYKYTGFDWGTGSTGQVNASDTASTAGWLLNAGTTIGNGTSSSAQFLMNFYDYANTVLTKMCDWRSSFIGTGGGAPKAVFGWGRLANTTAPTAAITSIEIKATAGTFSGGTALLYGVS